METRICKKCGVEKRLDEFNSRYNEKYKKRYYRYECKDCQKEYLKNNARKYYSSEHGKQKRQEYLQKNREEILEKNRKRTALYRETHKEEIHRKNKIYRLKNKDKINKYFNDRYKSDYEYKFKCNIRTMMGMSFRRKGKTKSKHLEEILGCDIEYLIKHLIKTYEQNYNEKWQEEYLSEVHIDHIKPLKYAKTVEDIEKLCHYTNLQLLKAKDNLKKQAN